MTILARDGGLIRRTFAAELRTFVTGSGPVQAVIDHRAEDFAPKSPVMVVISAGRLRRREGPGTGSSTFNTIFGLGVLIYVLDPGEQLTDWTATQRDDTLDTCEKWLADFIAANRQNNPHWEDLYHAENERSLIRGGQPLGGNTYTVELVAIDVLSRDVTPTP